MEMQDSKHLKTDSTTSYDYKTLAKGGFVELPVQKQISIDIKRTCPSHIMFQSQPGEIILYIFRNGIHV
jgi:hypothetical protein